MYRIVSMLTNLLFALHTFLPSLIPRWLYKNLLTDVPAGAFSGLSILIKLLVTAAY